jgi:endonuclease/exonuclease/phosphatase family metal-dependent hydrolase
MNYWEKTCDDPEKFCKTPEEIKQWKIDSLNYLNNSDYQIMLLQEINPIFYCDFNSCQRQQGQYIHKIGFPPDREIYYHELTYELSQEQVCNPEDWWGSAIIANKEYRLLKNHFLENKIDYYWGRIALMCYDFETPNSEIITIINLYNKYKYKKDINILNNMIKEIKTISDRNNNLIVLAGDFNASTQPIDNYPYGYPDHVNAFESIKQQGFKNCTMEKYGKHMNTIVKKKPYWRDYQNDYIFINKKYDPNKYETNINYDKKIEKITDHYPVELIIK